MIIRGLKTKRKKLAWLIYIYTWEGEAWMASSLPTRARHMMHRAKVLIAFPLRLNSIFLSVSVCEVCVRESERRRALAGREKWICSGIEWGRGIFDWSDGSHKARVNKPFNTYAFSPWLFLTSHVIFSNNIDG